MRVQHIRRAPCPSHGVPPGPGSHMQSPKRSFRSIGLLLPLVAALASPVSAQSDAKARQLFDAGKYAEAKTAFVALQKTDPRNSSRILPRTAPSTAADRYGIALLLPPHTEHSLHPERGDCARRSDSCQRVCPPAGGGAGVRRVPTTTTWACGLRGRRNDQSSRSTR